MKPTALSLLMLAALSPLANVFAQDAEAPNAAVAEASVEVSPMPDADEAKSTFMCRFKRVQQTDRSWIAAQVGPGSPPTFHDYGDGVTVELKHLGGSRFMVWVRGPSGSKKPNYIDGRKTIQLAMGTAQVDLGCYRSDYLQKLR